MLFPMLGFSILALILMCGKICVILAWTHLLQLFASCIRNFWQSDGSPVMSIILSVIGSIVCLVQSRGLVAVPVVQSSSSSTSGKGKSGGSKVGGKSTEVKQVGKTKKANVQAGGSKTTPKKKSKKDTDPLVYHHIK